jgi:hypothetical protein
VQITQPILPSKIYAPAGVVRASPRNDGDLGVTGLVPLEFGGLGVGLSTVGGSGTPAAAVLNNMGAPSALTGLEAVPQDHTIQGMCRGGPYMRQLAIATGKPGVASTIWISNEAKTEFSVLAAPEDMIDSDSLPLVVQNLAEYQPFRGAAAGYSVYFSALVNYSGISEYALPGYVRVSDGALGVAGLLDLPGNDGGYRSWVHSARFARLGDARDGGSPSGVPAIATLEVNLQIQRSPDAGFSGPYEQVLSVHAGDRTETYASWSIEAFSGYLGGTNCLLLLATGAGGASYLYRSTDRGLTWRPGASFPVSATGGRGHIHWISNLEVIMAIGRILYHSRDGGGSWRKIADVGDEVTALTGMADGSIYAGTQNGVVHRYAPLYW